MPLGGVVVVISFVKAKKTIKCGLMASIACWSLKTVLDIQVESSESLFCLLFIIEVAVGSDSMVLVRHHHFAVCD